jgi:hypothetical protein
MDRRPDRQRARTVCRSAAPHREGHNGTRVEIRIRLPLPPVIGGLLRRPLEAQLRREVPAAAAEDKRDIERRGTRAAPMTLRAAA